MSRFPPEYRMQRFRTGDVGYLRVRIVEGVKLPFGLQPREAVMIRILDAKGSPIGDTVHYVPEFAIVSKADAFAAVREALR